MKRADEIELRYGANPHQRPARAFRDGGLPFAVRNGRPGYVNMLDALNAWQLVRELRAVTGLAAAASFKHVSPAGAAVSVPLSDAARRAYHVGDERLSPPATAYARARGADRVSSFGDFAAFSDVVDVSAADLLRREVSDGVIAPGYDPQALQILSAKREGAYLVLEVDPAYEPTETERRDVFGVTIEQRRNDRRIDASLLSNVVTQEKHLSEEARRDLLVALVTLKYTQSNSIAFARDGQVIGVGAGQQSRIGCTRVAAVKAELWWLRQHPALLELGFRKGLSRPERDNAIETFLRAQLGEPEHPVWVQSFASEPARLDAAARASWMRRLGNVSYASDAYIPFRDNIDRAAVVGARYVAQPGGSLRDAEVIKACDEHGMVMAFTGLRLFHH